MRNPFVVFVTDKDAHVARVDALLFDAGQTGGRLFVENGFREVVISQQHARVISGSV